MSPLLQVHLSSKISIWRQERYLFANHICLWSKNALDCIKMLWVSSVPFSVRFLEYHIKITNVSCLTIFHLREFTNLKHHINQQHSQVRSLQWNIAVFQTKPLLDIFAFLQIFIVPPLKAQCCSLRSTSAVTVATAAISRQILSGTSQTSTKRSAK